MNILKNYNNKSILIVGGLTFLGKVLIEKLLRTTPYMKKIYILVDMKEKN